MCRLLGPLSRFLFCDVVFYRYTLTWLLVCETSTFIRALWNCIHLKQRPGHLIKSCFKVCLGTAQYIQDSRTLRPSYKLYWGHGAFVVLVRISLLLHFIADWCRSGVLFKACICAGISVMVCLHPCSGTTFIGQYSTLKILRVLKADSHCILVLLSLQVCKQYELLPGWMHVCLVYIYSREWRGKIWTTCSLHEEDFFGELTADLILSSFSCHFNYL